ncbi:MAG: hypothetical protein ABIR30_04675 [Chitinophagaceae bacterium]
MKRQKPLLHIVFFLLFFYINKTAFTQRIDTVYFNKGWMLCEKPFASYYRIGMINMDSLLFYKGRVLDFYMSDTMQMEGNYLPYGIKEGTFIFYYSTGKPSVIGQYTGNQMDGLWEYFYPNGQTKLKIDFAGNAKKFSVLEAFDSTGKMTASNGTGKFEMLVRYRDVSMTYRLEGQVLDGKRHGSWSFYGFHPILEKEVLVVKEVYEKGDLKKGTVYTAYPTSRILGTYKDMADHISAQEFDKLTITELFLKDPVSFPNRNNNDDLIEYFYTKKTSTYDVNDSTYMGSIVGVLNSLNKSPIRKKFNDPDKIYGGEIIFSLNDSGNIKEVEVNGNLSEKEKEQMQFFFQKFKNIHEIAEEDADVLNEHKIYFYSLIIADFVPLRYLPDYPEKIFIFSPLPYRAFIDFLKTKKRKQRKK